MWGKDNGNWKGNFCLFQWIVRDRKIHGSVVPVILSHPPVIGTATSPRTVQRCAKFVLVSQYPAQTLGCYIFRLENFSLIWRRYHCRWTAVNFDLCSTLMAIEQWGIFNVTHLLWHGPTGETPLSYHIGCFNHEQKSPLNLIIFYWIYILLCLSVLHIKV